MIQIKDKEEHFASIRFRHNPQNEMLLKALEHVQHFIIKQKLILVGGMAIDCALRLRGMRLYDDNEIPDYDFLSPRNSEDAYQLGQELCALEYPNVDVITAIHTTTMKVRVDGNVVADITYMPEKIFDRIRTLEYKGMQVVHPWMVMMDQFRSLSMPYENPPREVIFERWRKDVTRLNLLLSAYTLGDETAVAMPPLQRVAIPHEKTAMFSNSALQGWAALAWWERETGVTANKEYPSLEWSDNHAKLPVSYCSFMTCHPIIEWVAWSKSALKYYNPLYSYPRHVANDQLEVFDAWGERVTLADTDEPKVVSMPALMFYFFNMWLLRGDSVALIGIRRTHRVIQHMKSSPLSIKPLGEQSWNTATLYGVANILDHERVKNWKPQTQTFDECRVTRRFDAAASPLFAVDGEECGEFTVIVPPDQLTVQ